jgi:hypothetical protein
MKVGRREDWAMAREDDVPAVTGPAGERRGDLSAFAPWGLLAALLVLGGLLLAARAADAYTAASGLLFAGFGVFLGFRLLGRTLP